MSPQRYGSGGPRADLHVHTTASDGTWSPEEAVAKAYTLGLAAVGIADHDTVDGLETAGAAGRRLGILVVPGVEINTDLPLDTGATRGSGKVARRELHILGYHVDPGNQTFLMELADLRRARTDRMEQMLAKLQALPGTGHEPALSMADVRRQAGTAPLGRPHLARAMVTAGYATSVREAFERYLNSGCPLYVPRRKVDPTEAMQLIRAAGGVPVLAHPALAGCDTLIPSLVAGGLRGLEVYHPSHDPDDVRRYLALAAHHDLLITGGSDFHGDEPGHGKGPGVTLGSVTVPLERALALGTYTQPGRPR